MANIKVAGELKDTLLGQLFEIERQIRQSCGYPFDPLRLKIHLQAAIEGRFGLVAGNFKHDMQKDGWTLLENTPRRLSSAITGISFLKEGETRINGEEMARRARFDLDADYGQEDAEWLLENQDKIPVELQKFYLIFPATKWLGADGNRYVPYLYWSGGRWVLDFSWLDSGFYSYSRLVRPRE